jgi:hypothetical protein
MTHLIEKKLINFMFCSAGCSFLRAEGFSCSLDVLYGGPGIRDRIQNDGTYPHLN